MEAPVLATRDRRRRSPALVTADEAIAAIPSDSVIAMTGLSSEPLGLLEALDRRLSSGSFRGTLLSGMMLSGYEVLAPHLGNPLRLVTWFMPQTLLGDIALGPAVDFLPLTWAQVVSHVETTPIDVGFVQVSPADEQGFHSLGVSVSLNRSIVDSARVLVAQVNEQMPYTCGPDGRVHESEIDFMVEESRPLGEFPHRKPDARDTAIARNVARLIEDGSTLQVGIGTIPSEVLRILSSEGRSQMRVISQITDAVRDLIESGACVEDAPAAVVGDVLGTHSLYEWVHLNHRVQLVSGRETHRLEALARTTKLVSINSTLEIDLYGQLNSEALGAAQAGGIGGSVDFMMGAQFAEGQSIITLPSTTSGGRSRVVPQLHRSVVTVPRTLVQFVVTEWGSVDLRPLTQRQRAEALVQVAHPDHRPTLADAAAAIT